MARLGVVPEPYSSGGIRFSNEPSPLADFKHPFALSLAIACECEAIANEDCKRMFEIGDRRMRIAELRNLMLHALVPS